MKEIDAFIALGRRDRILTVLVSDEPEESFPAQLRFVEQDGRLIEKEPLAANIASADRAGMMKRLKSEKLRILAPMTPRRAAPRRTKTLLTIRPFKRSPIRSSSRALSRPLCFITAREWIL